ncbi:MAG: methionyl-tRNA formyltransferase [Bacteroidales bacterium]|nr:methionyl-tRNA formyltransferase [Bacteroidales bacterium]
MKIIFFGSNDISAAQIEWLINNNYNVSAVVTVPDKPAGRGLKLKSSEVKTLAIKYNLKLFQPEDLQNQEFIAELKKINADIFIVTAFRKLPEVIWKMPPLGTINVHFSLLPQYRGAAPINWAIINCEKKTGITIFFINDKIDEGEIIDFKEITIPERITFGKLKELMKNESLMFLTNTLKKIEKNTFVLSKQEELILPNTTLKKAPKIKPEDCKIDWNKSAKEIDCLIRGLSPEPCAFTSILYKPKNKKLIFKIYECECIEGEHNSDIAKIISDNKTFLYITAKKGLIQVKECQLENKKRLNIKDFLNGVRNTENYEIIL